MGVLAGWRFCPRRASAIAHEAGRVECDACGFVHYANTVSAVSALVVDRDRGVLLARRAHEPDAGLWDTPGGFLEEGEDPAGGLRRELVEETGLTIESFAGSRRMRCPRRASSRSAGSVPLFAPEHPKLRLMRRRSPRPLSGRLQGVSRSCACKHPRCTEGPANWPFSRGGGGGSLERNFVEDASYQVTPPDGSASTR